MKSLKLIARKDYGKNRITYELFLADRTGRITIIRSIAGIPKQIITEVLTQMADGAFSYEHACKVIEEIRQEMEGELEYHIQALAKMDAEDFSGEEEAYLYHKAVYGEEIEKIKEFFRLRPEVMREELKRLSSPLCE